MTVDPDYVTSGLFYVFYTRKDLGAGTLGDVVIERYERSAADPDVASPASATTVLVIDHPASNHNGGWLAFGPEDGFLYISTGDGGGACDSNQGTNGDGQRPDTLAGKMLRIDVHGVDPEAGPPDDCGVEAGPYGVPASNPFFGQEPACDEVWGYGLRNPFRFSFDRQTGDLYIGDVGQNKWEEINLQISIDPGPRQLGMGVPRRLRDRRQQRVQLLDQRLPRRPRDDLRVPAHCERLSGTRCCATTTPAGARSSAATATAAAQVPSIAGDYLYSDAACGQIWKTDTLDPANPAGVAASCWASGYQGTYGLAEDTQGELYIVRGGAGSIDCIHNGEGCFWAGAVGQIFADGFESGDTSAWSLSVP